VPTGPVAFTPPATVPPPPGIYIPKYFANETGSLLATPPGSTGGINPSTYISDAAGGLVGLCADKAGNFYAIEDENINGNTTETIVEFYSPDPSTPTRRIYTTDANAPSAIAVDPITGNIASAAQGSIGFYGPTDDGAIAPETTLAGAQTGLGFALSMIYDAVGNLYVLNQAHDGGPIDLLVFAPAATGNVAPMTVLSAFPGNFDPEFVSIDPTGNIYVTSLLVQESSSGDLLGFVPGVAVYAPPLTAASTPARTLNPSLEYALGGVAFDAAGNMYFSAADLSRNGYIVEFAAGAQGTAAPLAVLSSSGFYSPDGSIVVR
jgi:hypothetical protein